MLSSKLNTTKLILASSSASRLKLLARIGYNPDLVLAPCIDESPHKGELVIPLVKRLAYEKAQRIAASFPQDIVLGADTILAIGRRIIGKPAHADDAREYLQLLSGRRHKIYTAMCVVYNGKTMSRISHSIVKFKRLSEEEIDLYVNSKEWEGKAGGYSIQGIASAFIEWISGLDSTIIGLNLNIAYKMLSSAGVKQSTKIFA